MQCRGTKKDGSPCKNNAVSGNEYCYLHINGFCNKITYALAEFIGVKRRFLFWSLLFAIVMFLALGYLNNQYNQILERLNFKADAEVEISPYLYSAPFGEYLPIIITNTGDYTLRNVNLDISTCSMLSDNYFERYEIDLLPAHSARVIPFANEKTISSFKKGNCYPFSGRKRSFTSFSFNFFEISKGKNYSSVSTGCGICYFNASINANYTKQNKDELFVKEVRSYFDSPVDLTIEISSSD